jgi:hypothetical protein
MNLLQTIQGRLRQLATNGTGTGTVVGLNLNNNQATVEVAGVGKVSVELEFGPTHKRFGLHPTVGSRVEFGIISPETGFIISASEIQELKAAGGNLINGGMSVAAIDNRDVITALNELASRVTTAD